MKRIVMNDERGTYVSNDGERLRPPGGTKFRPGEKLECAVVGVSHSNAMRVAVWRPNVPRRRTEEVWDNGRRIGDRLSPNEHVLCELVRRYGADCAGGGRDVDDWCDTCLQALPLDVASPNKPWRGMTTEERLRLVADVARAGHLCLEAVGERYLTIDDVVARTSTSVARSARMAIEEFVLKIGAAHCVVVANAEPDAVVQAELQYGVARELVVGVHPHGVDAQTKRPQWFVRFVREAP